MTDCFRSAFARLPMILVIPAIDLRGGHCVRMREGLFEDERVYFNDPVKMAKLWRVQNARTLHLIDLDAARTAGGQDYRDNRSIIREIASSLDIPVEVGGGVRTLDDIEELFDMGVYRVVVGTAAVENPDFIEEAIGRYSPSRVIVGIDARDGEVCVEARGKASGIDAIDLALAMEALGVRRVVYTDIDRDGMLTGPNIDAYRALGERLTTCRVTAGGGVAGYRDLLRLQELAPIGVDSVVVGRALYENRFPCQQFWCWHRKDLVDLNIFSTAELAAASSEASNKCD